MTEAGQEYTWDPNGNLTSKAGEATYTWDVQDRLIKVVKGGVVVEHAYDADGNRVQTKTTTAGVTTTTDYLVDTSGGLSHVVAEIATTAPATPDAAGALRPRRRRPRHRHAAARRQPDHMDVPLVPRRRHRLHPCPDRRGRQRHRSLDLHGLRRTPPARRHGPAAAVVDTSVNRRLLTEADQAYTWDANGNLTSKAGEATYTWDVQDRLIKVVKGGVVVEHAYDADGNRVQTKTTAGGVTTTTDFLVDTSGGLSHVVVEIATSDASTTPTLQAVYIRGGDDLVALTRPAASSPTGWTSRWYHADGIGSIRALTDEAGNVTDRWTYTAFGELLEHTGTDPQPYAFAGEPYDPNSGLQHHRTRWMNPAVGRFVSADTFSGTTSDPTSLHRHLYGHANPENSTDPTGQNTIGQTMVGFSMQAVVIRAGLGMTLGIVDAALRGYSIRVGALTGAIGGVFGPLIPPKVAMAFVLYGVGEALWNEDYDSALFRAATFGFGYALQARGFGSFQEFKRFWGPAGRGRAWHHIVEQTPGNVGRFGEQAIHNPSNIAPLDHGAGTIHARVSGFYSSKQPQLTNSTTLTVRQWPATKSYAEQYQFGLEAMARFGGGRPMSIAGSTSSWVWPAVLAPFEEGFGFGQDE